MYAFNGTERGGCLARTSGFSRRGFLAAASGVSVALRLGLSADAKDGLPIVRKRVEKAFHAPGGAPNDLQDAADGLWILDQADPNKVFKVRYGNGAVIHEIQTESIHGSGITNADGRLHPNWLDHTTIFEGKQRPLL
jgi:hypothetical protein